MSDVAVGVRREVSIDIAAEPGTVYDFISAVEPLGGLGPECARMTWVEPGRVFEGTNRIGEFEWTTRCTVVAAEPARRFAWEVTPSGAPDGPPSTRWSFDLEAVPGGTRVVHAFEILGLSPALSRATPEQLADRWRYLAQAMGVTLDGVKRAIESGAQ